MVSFIWWLQYSAGKLFIFQISTVHRHVVISLFDSTQKGQQYEIKTCKRRLQKRLIWGKYFSREDLECKTTCLINEDYWCDYNSKGEERAHWAEHISRNREQKEGREDLDLCRTVQNAADELDQLLHGLDRLAGQEVLLVGCVEDDNGGHRHLAEKQNQHDF